MKKFLIFISLIFIYFSASSVFGADKIEINTASLEQLETLTGIGPVKAQAIIDARPFSSVDDLIRVKGIGEKTLQKIKDQGLAYVENQAMQPILQTPIETPPETPHEALAEPLDVLPTETPPQDVVVPIVYPAGIVINEILPSPEGADETEEWIEIYNPNNTDADLSYWSIQDKEGKSTKYVFPKNTKMPPYGYLILKRPETKITLNNDKDGLTLFNSDNRIADEVLYKEAPPGQSYNRTSNGWKWSSAITPAKKNIISELEKTPDKELTAAIDAATPGSYNKFRFLLSSAIILSLLFATSFYLIFKRIKKHVRSLPF